MYDLRSSSVCKRSSEGERPLSLPLMLFALLVILFLSSSLQTALLLPAFFISEYRVIFGMGESESFLEELLLCFEGFIQSDVGLLIQLLSTAFTVVLTLVLCTVLLKRRPASLALCKRGAALHYLLGLVLGGALFAACFGVASINGSLKLLGIASPVKVGMILLLFVGYVVQAASEEILFRGFLMCDLARRFSPVTAVLLSSAVFATAHFSNAGIGPIAVLNLFLFGVFVSLWVLRTGNLLGACAIHTAWNFTEGHVFGCRVSGFVADSTVFHCDALTSLSLTNGGAFGPEGGVAVTVVFLIVIVLLLVFPSRKEKQRG